MPARQACLESPVDEFVQLISTVEDGHTFVTPPEGSWLTRARLRKRSQRTDFGTPDST